MPAVYAFVDLDDSLFCSTRKRRPGVGFEPAALLRNGKVISFTSPAQQTMIQWLQQGATLIPVTARSVAVRGPPSTAARSPRIAPGPTSATVAPDGLIMT